MTKTSKGLKAHKPKKAPPVEFSFFDLNGEGTDKQVAFPNQFEMQHLIDYYRKAVELGEAYSLFPESFTPEDHANHAAKENRLAYWIEVQRKSVELQSSRPVLAKDRVASKKVRTKKSSAKGLTGKNLTNK
ncbi:MAG: hypothetical protein ACLQQ4_01675 [Bacteroidia bacterium]